MKRIKFKFEYVPLSDEQIEQHKNFDALMAAYTLHPKPSWKSRLFGNKFSVYTAGLITGAAITASMWWGVSQFNGKHELTGNNKAQQEQFQNENSNIAQEQMKAEQRSSANSAGESAGIEKSSPENSSLNETLQNDNAVKQKSSVASSSNSENKSSASQNASEVSSAQKEPVASTTVASSSSSAQNKTSVSTREEGKQENKQDEAKSFLIAKGAESNSAQESASSIQSQQSSEGNKTESENQYPDSVQEIADEFKLSSPAKTQVDSLVSKTIAIDTLSYSEGIVRGDSDFIATPQDTSAKKALVVLPKIDVSDEWNASKKTVSKIADSIGNKTSSFFSRLFKQDTSQKVKSTEANSLAANDQLQDSFKHRFAQVTFVSPISSDGIDAKLYMHNISFNVLQGFNGAVNGFELGGLANVDAGYMTGVQIAGIANHILGDIKGVQIGGLYSSGRNLHGFQTGGIVSVATGTVRGVQVGGVTNLSGDTLNGLQIGGVVNLAIGKSYSHSWQIAGVSNISSGESKGGQISGVFNYSTKRTGLQISTINFAMKLKGFQLGLINLSDTIDGDAIGLISVSRNGQHHVDLFGGEILYSSVGIKLGTPHVYNIFAAGVAPRKDTVRLGFGLGIGGHIPISEKFFMNIDGICWTIHDNNLKDWEEINLWNEIRFTPGYQITKGMAVYLGPTLNAQVYHPRYAAVAPYTIYESHTGTTWVDGWVGFVVGLQFF